MYNSETFFYLKIDQIFEGSIRSSVSTFELSIFGTFKVTQDDLAYDLPSITIHALSMLDLVDGSNTLGYTIRISRSIWVSTLHPIMTMKGNLLFHRRLRLGEGKPKECSGYPL